MLREIKTTLKVKKEILTDYGISTDDKDCVSGFSIHSCTYCFERFPVAAGNCYDDIMSQEKYYCPDCGKETINEDY